MALARRYENLDDVSCFHQGGGTLGLERREEELGRLLVGDPFIDSVKQRYGLGHQRVLRALEDLTDEQMRWHPGPDTHSISWNVWHLGRYAHDERHLGQIIYLRRLMALPRKLERPGWTAA